MDTVLRGRAIVLFLPQPEPQPLIALRRQFDPLSSAIGAHVTLVFPFHSDLSPQAVREHVADSVRGLEPIAVRLAGVTGARDVGGADMYYLFLNVERGNDAIIELHDRLYRGPFEAYVSREFTYVPHVTVGRCSGIDAFHAALEAAGATPIDFEATLDTVTVYDAVTRAVESAVAL